MSIRVESLRSVDEDDVDLLLNLFASADAHGFFSFFSSCNLAIGTTHCQNRNQCPETMLNH